MKTIQIAMSLLLVSFSLSLLAGTPSLESTSPELGLKFTHQYQNKVKYLVKGERVKVRVKNQPSSIRGKITNITDSSITLSRAGETKTIPLSDIDLIQKTTVGNIIASIFGVYAGINGIAIAIIAARDLGAISGSILVGFWVIFILFAITIGLGLAFVGTLPFWARAKRFNLASKTWKMEVKNIIRDSLGRIREEN
jgi:hypothetical protein